MSSEISKKGFPTSWTTEKLLEQIEDYGDTPIGDDFDSAKYAKGALGVAELQRRISKKFGAWSLSLSGVAIILSLSAVFFAYRATQISDAWQDEQLSVLVEIRDLRADRQ